MRRRDALGGFAAFAFTRSIARQIAWLGDFASASAWLARPVGLDFGPWQQPLFGSALAGLTKSLARPDVPREPGDATAPGRNRQTMAVAPPSRRPADVIARPAPQSRARQRAAADAIGPARMSTAGLTALTGPPSRAVRAGSPPRAIRPGLPTLPSQPGAGIAPPMLANDVAAGRPRPRAADRISRPAFVTAADAPERLSRVLGRRVRRSLSAMASPHGATAAIEAAWRQRGVTAPESGLRLQPAAVVSIGQAAEQRNRGAAPGFGPPRAHATGTVVEAGTTRRRLLPEPLAEPGHGRPRNGPGSFDLPNAAARAAARAADTASPLPGGVEAAETPSFAALAASGRAPVCAAPTSATPAAAYPASSRSRLDPFEFAEQLRDVLLADARRHGIDV